MPDHLATKIILRFIEINFNFVILSSQVVRKAIFADSPRVFSQAWLGAAQPLLPGLIWKTVG